MMGFTDIHSHFVYDVDDGAKSRGVMEAMLDAAHADGITSLFATPHITPGVKRFDFEVFSARLDEARSYCKKKYYDIELYEGAEVMYTPTLFSYVADHRLPTLANSEQILMEFVTDITLHELESVLDLMGRYGYVTVLAHIERYPCLLRGGIAGRLKDDYDVRYQVNANTVLNEHGLFRTRRIHSWFQDKLVDFIASDAHDVKRRPFKMKRVYAELKRKYGMAYADMLTGMQ